MKNRNGFALEATLFVLVLMAVLMLSAYTGAAMATRSANLDYRTSRVSYAAEAGADAIMAQLADALEDGYLSDEELFAVTPPTMAGFTFKDLAVQKIGGVVVETVTNGPFAGLYSMTQKLEITSEATDPMGNVSAVIVSAKSQAFPIFQFGVFFEGDLEATNGPDMTFAGWVHSNGNIYLSSDNAWYKDMITTPNKVYHDRKDRHIVENGVWIADATGTDVKLLFDSRTHPAPAAFRAESNTQFDDRLMTDAYGVDSLSMPLPAGVSPYELLLPRKASDGEQERKAKYAWKADYYIEISLGGDGDPMNCGKGKGEGSATCSIGDGGGVQGGQAAQLCNKMKETRFTGLKVPKVKACENFMTFTWEAFWESREQRYVDVLDIDVGQLFDWTDKKNDKITPVLYVTFINENNANDPAGDGVFPAVRLVNGAQLGNPFTVATSHPMYVQGDYNTGIWRSASFVSDAISLLSNNWNDANHQAAAIVKPVAVNTTYYGAILAGHSATPCDHEDAGCPGGFEDFYGGGIENYPRFLENWSGKTLTYVGALVSIHESEIAVGTWSGRPYSPPKREWSFDTRFEDPTNLPPGTPVVGNIVHTAFRPVY